MAKAEAKRLDGGVHAANVARGLRESALWIFGALALILFAALVSYDRADPAFSSTGQPGPVTNLIGPFGAWLSDLFFVLFGAPAYLFPIMLGIAGYRLFQDRDSRAPMDRRSASFRGLGFFLALASSCALATLHFAGAGFPNTAGGIVGSLLGEGLAHSMSFLGATLLLLAVWLGSVSLATGISWLDVMDRIGAAVLRGVSLGRERLSERRDQNIGKEVKQAREVVVREEQKKVAERKPPKIEAPAPKVEKSERVEKEKQVPLFERAGASALPALSLLDDPPPRQGGYSAEALEAMSRLVELKLRDFGVEAEVVEVHPGPVITRFELRPAPGVKVAQISNLAKDLARSLSAISVRVVEIIPGKSTMGLEIPNESREMVTLGEIIKSKAYDELASPLALVLGKDIGGNPVVADLSRMPHLLVGGTTGSGKSTAVNAMVLSLLYKSTPDHVRLIMIDPKMLELSVYEGIPHLLAPVVTDMKQAANALRWCVAEMERRYQLMASAGVRNLAGFNRKVKEAADEGRPLKDPIEMKRLPPGGDPATVPDLEPLPNIVVIVDELADMMMIVGKKVEELIARLAQKARASGIHLILATQRPSVDVITGLIKANIPTRIAFQVSAKPTAGPLRRPGGGQQRGAARHRRVRAQPSGAHRPVPVDVGGSAGDAGGGGHRPTHRGPGRPGGGQDRARDRHAGAGPPRGGHPVGFRECQADAVHRPPDPDRWPSRPSGDLCVAAPARIRRCRSVSRGGRHRAGRQAAGPVLQRQYRGAGDDRGARSRRAGGGGGTAPA